MNPMFSSFRAASPACSAELERGAAAAGPQFFWDLDAPFPPAADRAAVAGCGGPRRAGAALSGLAAARRGGATRLASPCSPALGGGRALRLTGAVGRADRLPARRLGPDRAVRRGVSASTSRRPTGCCDCAAAGLESRFVPAAQAVHLFAQSSIHEPRAAGWFADAERLFRRRHLGAGRRRTRVLDALGTAPHRRAKRRRRRRSRFRGRAAPVFPLAALRRRARRTGSRSLSRRAVSPPPASACGRHRGDRRVAHAGGDLAPAAPRRALDPRNRRPRPGVVLPCTCAAAPRHGGRSGVSDRRVFGLVPMPLGTRPRSSGPFRRSFGTERSLAEWRWKFLEPPRGSRILLAFDGDGELACQYAAITVDVVWGGEPIAGGADRRRLLAPPARRSVRAGAPSSAPWSSFSPNARRRRSCRGRLRLRIPRRAPSARRRRHRPLLRAGARSARLASCGRTAGAQLFRSRSWISEGFDAHATDRLWRRSRERYPHATVRDAAWFQWRYERRPGGRYLQLGVRRAGETRAWAVVDSRRRGRALGRPRLGRRTAGRPRRPGRGRVGARHAHPGRATAVDLWLRGDAEAATACSWTRASRSSRSRSCG